MIKEKTCPACNYTGKGHWVTCNNCRRYMKLTSKKKIEHNKKIDADENRLFNLQSTIGRKIQNLWLFENMEILIFSDGYWITFSIDFEGGCPACSEAFISNHKGLSINEYYLAGLISK